MYKSEGSDEWYDPVVSYEKGKVQACYLMSKYEIL